MRDCDALRGGASRMRRTNAPTSASLELSTGTMAQACSVPCAANRPAPSGCTCPSALRRGTACPPAPATADRLACWVPGLAGTLAGRLRCTVGWASSAASSAKGSASGSASSDAAAGKPITAGGAAAWGGYVRRDCARECSCEEPAQPAPIMRRPHGRTAAGRMSVHACCSARLCASQSMPDAEVRAYRGACGCHAASHAGRTSRQHPSQARCCTLGLHAPGHRQARVPGAGRRGRPLPPRE